VKENAKTRQKFPLEKCVGYSLKILDIV